jgi:hypothetical protein
MRRYIIIVLLIFNVKAFAQTLPSYINVKTPETAAFNRNLEAPVSMYTGVPSITIPLYEINIKGVNIPINLSYHAGGIRVDQDATWVGLGWNLDYGGSISRKIRGSADEYTGGYLKGTTVDDFLALPLNQTNAEDVMLRMSYLGLAKDKKKDFMPDEFYYAAAGYSGKFMFNQQQNKFILFPKEDIAVSQLEKQPDGTILPFYKWNLKLPNGTSVEFGAEATTSSRTFNDLAYNKDSWLVKTIKNTNNDSISYTYENFNYDTYKISGENFIHSYVRPYTDAGWTLNRTVTRFYYLDSEPISISFPTGKITFFTSERGDSPAKKLNEIVVYDNSNNVIKRIKFNYSYFYGDNYDAMSLIGSYENLVQDNYRFQRLKLNSVIITSADGAKEKKYSFDYNTTGPLPSKYTFAQDHWGFFNNKPNTTVDGFIPRFMPSYITGGDRRVDPLFSQAFSMKSVTYPEGGRTEYVFENNTARIDGIPSKFLDTYEDNNLLDKYAFIGISGPGRLSAFLSGPPSGSDYIDANGNKFFYKDFTIPATVYVAPGFTWDCVTTFGISSKEVGMPAWANNARFSLEKLVNGFYVSVNEFNTNSGTAITGTSKSVIKLDYGQYRLAVRLSYGMYPAGSDPERQPYSLNFFVRWREMDPQTQRVNIGGLRVKDINFRLPNGTLARKKHFDYINPYAIAAMPTLTSGRVASFPYYFQLKSSMPTEPGPAGPTPPLLQATLTSSSNQPMETTSGSYCGYEYVNEIDVDSANATNNLKKVHHFSYTPPLFSQYYTYMGIAAYEPSDWKRGWLLSTEYYKGPNIIKKEDYVYNVWSPHLSNGTDEDYVQEINTDLISNTYLSFFNFGQRTVDFFDYGPTVYSMDALKHGDSDPVMYCAGYYYGVGDYTHLWRWNFDSGNYMCYNMQLRLPYFIKYTGFTKPKSKTTTSYENGHPIVQTENYYYEKTPLLNQQTRVQTFGSMKDTLETRTKYPIDSASVNVYSHMLMRHILDPVIEQSSYRNGVFLKSSNTNYKQWTDTAILAPVREWIKVGTSSPFVKTTYLNYDNAGNILSAMRPGGAKVSVQWGYNNTYPVAQALNAPVNDIFFESFEEGAGNSTINDAKTGHYSKMVSYSKTLTGFDNGSYVLSYWKKTGNSWSLVTTDVTVNTGSYTISLIGQVDDVRFYPKGAQMTAYTYDSLVGITSVTDVRNSVAYYEYDGLQRLINLKDKDKNIIKDITYNYGSQSTNVSKPVISLANIYYTAVTISYTTTADASTGCVLKFTDLTTGLSYESPITCNGSAGKTVGVPAGGRNYRFVAIQNLAVGGQVTSDPLDVFVPTY